MQLQQEPEEREDAGSRRDARSGPAWRLVVAAGVVAVLVAVIAVLAFRLSASPGSAQARSSPSPAPTASQTLSVAQIYQKAGPSVVLVQAGGKLGAGVVADDDGTILTADHVVAGASSVTVTFSDGTVTTASVASSDPKQDIATLTPAKLPTLLIPASLGGGVSVGAQVVAIGNPLGLTDSVSAGIVSGLGRTADTADGTYSGLIQFDAAVNPGSSGGPLLNDQGLVVGIVVSIANPAHADAFAGIGFAVPIGAALGGGSGSGPGGGGPGI